MSNPSKRKGSAGEREVARLFAAAGLTEAARMPMSGAVPDFPGDVRLDGYLVEVKRTERLDLWGAIRQAEAAARGGRIPIVVFRRSWSPWYVIQEAESWAAREAKVRRGGGR